MTESLSSVFNKKEALMFFFFFSDKNVIIICMSIGKLSSDRLQLCTFLV